MNTYAAVVSYKGTAYAGWQIQPNAPTIQHFVQEALTALFNEKIKVTASGRTDAGVHSSGQVIAFSVQKTSIPPQRLSEIINKRLPDDISFNSVYACSPDFHPRYQAKARLYRYYLTHKKNRPQIPLSLRPYVTTVYQPLKLTDIRALLKPLTGTHNFSSFCALNDPSPHKVREIFYSSIFRNGAIVTIDICANAFLRNMVRAIVGSTLQALKEKRNHHHLKELLLQEDCRKAPQRAPAEGLTLKRVYYTPVFGSRPYYQTA